MLSEVYYPRVLKSFEQQKWKRVLIVKLFELILYELHLMAALDLSFL